MNRLQERYNTQVVETLTKQFGYKSVMEVPAIEKVVINMVRIVGVANVQIR